MPVPIPEPTKPEMTMDHEIESAPPEASYGTQEWNRLKSLGDQLKNRMNHALGLPNLADDTLVFDAPTDPPEPPPVPLPTIPTATPKAVPPPMPIPQNEMSLDMPLDPTAVPKPTEQTTCFSDIKEMRYIKLGITTLTVMTEKQAYANKHLFLECILPLPSMTPGKLIHDSLKINHKGSLENIYKFSHESMHEINTSWEGIFSKLAEHTIKFKAWLGDAGSGNAEFGRGEVAWEKIMLASSFAHNAVVELWKIEAPAAPPGSSRQKAAAATPRQKQLVGRLSVALSLLQGEANDQ
jgi:hypothetical protein